MSLFKTIQPLCNNLTLYFNYKYNVLIFKNAAFLVSPHLSLLIARICCVGGNMADDSVA